MRLLRLSLLLLALCSLGAAPTITHVLAWETQAQAETFAVEQCANTQGKKGGCVFALVVTLPGTQRQWESGPLPRQRSFCWRVRPVAASLVFPYSNSVCA